MSGRGDDRIDLGLTPHTEYGDVLARNREIDAKILRESAAVAAQPGNSKLEIGEVWNDGRDVKAPVAPGRKDDAGKPRWDLLPASVVEVVKVLTVGAKRYGDDNWRGLETPRRRYYSALLRHVTAWYYGERNDPDDGLHHLAHAMCCALFLLELDK